MEGPSGYRLNRAARVRMDEAKRKKMEDVSMWSPLPNISSKYRDSTTSSRYGTNTPSISHDKPVDGEMMARKVLRDRGSLTSTQRQVLNQAEEVARLDKLIKAQKALRSKLERISKDMATLGVRAVNIDYDDDPTI